jgi:hypothetical protein
MRAEMGGDIMKRGAAERSIELPHYTLTRFSAWLEFVMDYVECMGPGLLGEV